VRSGIRYGIPQDSVLGPTLWNLGYDSILRLKLPVGCSALYYADDTLLVVRGSSFCNTLTRVGRDIHDQSD